MDTLSFIADQTSTHDRANSIGLAVTDDPTEYAYKRGQAIGVVSIYKLVNGKSVFGVAEEGRKIDIGSIIIDDAQSLILVDYFDDCFKNKIHFTVGLFK